MDKNLWFDERWSAKGSAQFSSVAQSCLTLCDPMNRKHTRPPCPSPSPGVHSDSHPLSLWCRDPKTRIEWKAGKSRSMQTVTRKSKGGCTDIRQNRRERRRLKRWRRKSRINKRSSTASGRRQRRPLQRSRLDTPGTAEPGGLQSMGSLRVGHDSVTSLSLFTFLHWRRKWQPTPVFLPGESQGRGSLVCCHLWGRTESDTTEET